MVSKTSNTPSSMLALFPEELLERILYEVIVLSKPTQPSPSRSYGYTPISSVFSTPSPSPTKSRSPSPPTSRASSRPSSRPGSPALTTLHPHTTANHGPPISIYLTPLLTCRLFHRIALPLYYRVLQLNSLVQTRKLLIGSLRPYPERARWVRRVIFGGVWSEGGELLRLLAKCINDERTSRELTSNKGKGRETDVDETRTGLEAAGLQVLEITIDAPMGGFGIGSSHLSPGPMTGNANGSGSGVNRSVQRDFDAEEFCEGLEELSTACQSAARHISTTEDHPKQDRGPTLCSLKHVVLRKPQNVYLTQPRARMVIGTLAGLLEEADLLETAYIAFRLSDDPVAPTLSTTPSSSSEVASQHSRDVGPVTALTQVLSTRPNLHTFATHLPSVWNEAILRIAKNEALQRIVLVGSHGPHGAFNFGLDELCCMGNSKSSGDTGSVGGSHQNEYSSIARPLKRTSSIPHHSHHSPFAPAAQVLPPNPVERVYAATARGCDGYAVSVGSGGMGAANDLLGIGGTGLFMTQARKHERLCGLIRAGSSSLLMAMATPIPPVPTIRVPTPPVQRHQTLKVPIISIPTPAQGRANRLAVPSASSSLGTTTVGHSLEVASASALSRSSTASPLNSNANPTSPTSPSLYASCSSWLVSVLPSPFSPTSS